MSEYAQTLNRFYQIVKTKKKDETMMAIIIDSPWMPGYMGVNTLDFYFDQEIWLKSYVRVLKDLPGVAFIPGSWVEFGMAAEPSGWGIKIEWSSSSPPSLHPYSGGLTGLIEADIPDPEKDGFMPVVLRQYERTNNVLKENGIAPRMAAARGPLAVAAHLVGITELLTATRLKTDSCLALFNKTTQLCIKWLQCQLTRMDNPIGVLVLDDIVGMLSPKVADKIAFPFLKRIFDSFPNLIHIYHNDTPNEKIFAGISKMNMDVFNFSHEIDIKKAREFLGNDIVIMGNIAPVDILVRGSIDQVKKATHEMLQNAEKYGPIIVSAGGGVSPETPIENLQTMAEIVNTHINI